MADHPPADPSTAADPASAAVAAVPEILRATLDPSAFESLCRYRDILADRGIDWGLLGPREVDRLWERHLANSLAVTELIPPGADVVDVGSGAGLPGIPVAVARPDARVDLLEPLLRRSNFLTHTVDELGITDRVTVRRARAEDLRRTYEAVLSRALAPLDRLIRWCLPLMRPTGQVLAIKGASAEEEVARHQRLIVGSGLQARVRGVRSDPRLAPTTVIQLTLR